MARIVVCGGSVIGLSTAMLLARDGHQVTVLEADGSTVPDDPSQAWEAWDRRGVAQFHQPHNLFARARHIMEADLPGLTERLLDAGGTWIDPLAGKPPSLADQSVWPGDERFRYVNARRPVLEAVVAQVAVAHEGVTVRRGVSVAGLRAEPMRSGPPTVTGVRIDRSPDIDADLVIDATGRRTKLPEWLAALGAARPQIESEDLGFVYYTRFFRGPEPPAIFAPPLSHMGSVSVLTLVGDADTWSVTVFTSSSDTALRGLRDPARFHAFVQACPLHAHWLRGEPIGEVEVMAGVLDKFRRYVLDSGPVATGVVPVGDAWACTNPSAGRGISVGLLHAQRLRDAVRDGIGDGDAFVRRFDHLTETDVAPFVRNQITEDRVRVAEMVAAREEREQPAPDPRRAAFGVASGREAVVFRGMIETVTCLALPSEVFARPAVAEAIERYVGQVPSPMPGPNRAEVLALLA